MVHFYVKKLGSNAHTNHKICVTAHRNEIITHDCIIFALNNEGTPCVIQLHTRFVCDRNDKGHALTIRPKKFVCATNYQMTSNTKIVQFQTDDQCCCCSICCFMRRNITASLYALALALVNHFSDENQQQTNKKYETVQYETCIKRRDRMSAHDV